MVVGAAAVAFDLALALELAEPAPYRLAAHAESLRAVSVRGEGGSVRREARFLD